MKLTAKKLSLFKHTYVIVSRFGDSVFIIYKVSFCLPKLKNLLDSKWFKTESTLQEVRPVDFRYLRLATKLFISSDQGRLMESVIDMTEWRTHIK